MQLASAYSAGVLVANVLALSRAWPLSLCAVSSLLAFAALFGKRLTVAGLALLSAIFFAGASLAAIERTTTAPDSLKQLLDSGVIDDRQSLTLTGVLDGPPEFARDRVYLLLRVEKVAKREWESKASGLVSLLATFKTGESQKEYRQLNLHYGLRIRVKTPLNYVDKFRNPGLSTLTEYLGRKGYDATGIVKESTSIGTVGETNIFAPLAWLYRWREKIQFAIDQSFSRETAGVLDAAVLGNRYNLSKTAADRFREAGTFHVLVISGLHITFIGGIVFLIARRFTKKRSIQFVLSSSLVWSYAVAVGAEASVVRAALMFTFVALGGVMFRPASSLNALGGAALVLLLKSPKDLFDPSFQLTFLSVLAIVTVGWPLLQTFRAIGYWRPTRETPYPPSCSPYLRLICEGLFWSEKEWKQELVRSPHVYRLFKTPAANWLETTHLQRPIRYIFNAIVVSVGVQTVMLPLLVVYFHRLSLSSLVLNIIVSLLLAILSAIALVALLISQVSVSLAEPILKLANAVDWVMVHSVDPFSRAGVASLRIPEYSGWSCAIYFLYYLPLILLLVALARWQPMQKPGHTTLRSKWLSVAVMFQIVFVGTVVCHPLSSGRADGKLHVDFLDVGQGDSALVTMPNGTTMLVDAGGRPTFNSFTPGAPPDDTEREGRSIGEMVVSEYLWWRGLDTVDYVLATHADADHIDGLNDVVRNFSVRSALVARTPPNDAEYVEFSNSLIETGTHLQTIQSGDELRFGDVKATVLWPLPSSDPNAPSRNNDSVVIRLQFGDCTVLLTGDIEKEAEAQILAGTKDVSADVVKVPHHGSRTSSTEGFVAATHPRFAIISVGRTSMFGHPHKEVVERWTSSGAEVLTTGTSGTISVTTDGKTLTLKKYVE
jgi:competence protein ComEC